jgi:hypothetical protein
MGNFMNKSVEVHVDKQLNALSVKFLGFVTFDDFVKIVEYEWELIRQNNLNKCVVDLRQIPVYDKGMPEYVRDVWFSTAYSLGIRHVAFVVPEAPLAQRSMSRAHKDTGPTSGIDAENFQEDQDALDWLKTC